MRICLIDDNEMVGEALALVLSDMGHEVHFAAGGQAGLAAIAAEAPDVAVIDLEMPAPSGREVIAALRKTRPGLPLAAVSGRASSDHGADAFIEKPFTPRALLARLEQLLGARAA